jgi:hypothetical protein
MNPAVRTPPRAMLTGLREAPDTFEVTIAVTKDGMAFVLDWPDWLGNLGYFDAGYEPETVGLTKEPTEPGIYRCTVSVPLGWPLTNPMLPITTVYHLCNVDGSDMNAKLLRLGGTPVIVKAD